MKRVLVIHPSFQAPGGGNAVGAWVLQALREDFDVTLLAWSPFDLERVNGVFGTDLRPQDFQLRLVPESWRRAHAKLPLRMDLLKLAMLQRYARGLLRRERFDVAIGTANEIDVGRRAVQYVHFPWALWPRPEDDLEWYHFAPLVRIYRALTLGIAGISRERIARNETFANSAWTGRRYAAWYGVEPRVLYPPVHVDRAPRGWAERTDTFACIGRISPEKRILEAIEILAQVRRRGHAVALLVCGQRDDAAYERRVLAAARAHDWIDVRLDLPRSELLERASACRYGIHGMIGEHFGIGVAEAVRLGAVCFAPADGGPAEILGDERLLYASVDDAVRKICAVLEGPALLAELRAHLAGRAERFSAETFMREVRAACERFAASGGAAGDPRRTSAPLRAFVKRILPEPCLRPLGRIYRVAYPCWARLTGPRTEKVATSLGWFWVPRDAPHDAIVRAIREDTVFEADIVEIAAEYLTEGSTAVDVGANLGQMALLFSRMVGASGSVVAVEANPFLFGLLERNLRANGCTSARAVFGAAYRESGVPLRFPPPRFWRHPSYGSYGVVPGARRGQVVPSLALDDLGIERRVDFLKIDAQGSDLDVMRGARRLIERDRMPILFEYEPEYDRAFGVSFRDYEAFVAEIGYRIVRRANQNVLIEP